MPESNVVFEICPFYDKSTMRCEVAGKDPNSISSNRRSKYCLSESREFEKCHLFIFRESSEESFQLTKVETAELKGLKELSGEKIADIVLTEKSSIFSSCPNCKKKPEKIYGKSTGLCHIHLLKFQKTLFLLGAINGFEQLNSFKFEKFRQGPYSQELTSYAGYFKENLDKYYDTKSDPNYHLSTQERSILIRLVDKYFNLDYEELGLLASLYFVIKEESNKKPAGENTLALEKDDYSDILDKIRTKYPDYDKNTGKSASFDRDVKIYRQSLVRVFEKLKEFYVPVDVSGAGSSGIVIKLKEVKVSKISGKDRFVALKFPKPKYEKFDITNLNIIDSERKLLAQLSHPNIVKVITCDEQKYGDTLIPWYIMEYIEAEANDSSIANIKPMDLDELIKNTTDNAKKYNEHFGIEGYLKLISDIASSIVYLHENKIIHCDIKPGNILVTVQDNTTKGMLIDLGYAHSSEGETEQEIRVKYDANYAHGFLLRNRVSGSQPGANTSQIKRGQLTTDLDIVSFGKTIREIVLTIANPEIFKRNLRDSKYNFWLKYLKLIAGRAIYKEMSDKSLVKQQNLSIDLTNILGQFKAILDTFQLSYESSEYMRRDILKMLDKVTLSELVPEFNSRESNVLDLGAKGERVILTQRLKGLIENKEFTRLSSITQLGIVSYVFPRAIHTRYEHCLGAYSNAIEYVKSLWYDTKNPIFRSVMEKEDIVSVVLASLLHDIGYYPLSHEMEEIQVWPKEINHQKYSEKIVTVYLAEIIETDWKVKPDKVVAILRGNGSNFQDILLHTIIDGPIDVDKMDYLVRDGEHLGVVYPSGIDKQWLLRNLTVCWNNGERKPSIGVYEKGRAAAESLAYVRYEMHSVAYWHHTVRIIKAMLRYAASRIDSGKEYSEPEHFNWFHSLPFMAEPLKKNNVNSNISYTDFLQLSWINEHLDMRGNKMIERIFQRRLYKRLITLDESLPDTSSLYLRIRSSSNDPEKLISLETKLETIFFGEIKDNFSPNELEIMKGEPLILLDVPKSKDENAKDLFYVPELFADELTVNLLSNSSQIWNQLYEKFSGSIGKIRILCSPDYKNVFSHLTRNKLITIIEKAIDSIN